MHSPVSCTFMNILRVNKPVFSFLLFLLLHHIKPAISNPPYTPTDTILTNCGSSGIASSPDGRNWTGDFNFKFGPIETSNSGSVAATASSQVGGVEYVPYMTARISKSQFSYTFPVTTGHKFIRLYFYSVSYDPGRFDRFQDFFDVKAGAYTLLRNFSASLYTEARNIRFFFKEFCLNVKDDDQQQLNLTFSPSGDSYAFINGIEIWSMPTNLYHTPTDGLGLSFIGEREKFYVRNDTVLEKMYRLNVGGNTLSSRADTGMYRVWESDYPSYTYWTGSINSDPSLSLNYSRIPTYTAPDDVYLSARQMDVDTTNNLTWVVNIDSGFKYLVRLHFCEFVLYTKVNQRRFNIFLDNQTAKLGFDVIESSGGNRTPIYNDYVLKAGNKSGTAADDYSLFITLRPNASSVYNDSFLNGMEIYKLNDTVGNLAGPNPLVSIPPPPAPARGQPSPTTKKSNLTKTLLIAVGGSVVGLVIILSLLAVIVIWRLRKNKHHQHHHGSYYKSLSCCLRMSINKSSKGQSTRSKASSLPEELCRHFSLLEIKSATNNFDDSLIIGEGGFGNVYRGEIDEGDMVVAIKRLNPESRQGALEFKTEIEMLSQLRHVHLVSLIGYCHEEGEMILVYDYMINGTLRQHLYDTNNDPLPWKKRIEICIGGARGLHYLHAGVKHTIIHRDIKTTNILLDENWVAKVSDFGLSKIGVNDTAVITKVKGTWGYMDPEYARGHQLTEKSDVFSFGVVLFEVLCARKPIDKKLDEEQWSLTIWARKCIQNGTIHEIIDPYLMGRISPDCFNKFVEIAESCIRDNGIERPSMHDVMEKLQFALELQEAADSEKKDGDQYVYPLVSFHASRYTNIVGMDSSNSSGLKDLYTDATGQTLTSDESSSTMPSHAFSNTINSTKI